jgi:hypothetical protein
MWRDSVFQGFFHTPLWQNRSPAATIALRSITTDSPARIMKHEENNSSGPVTFPLGLRHPRLLARPPGSAPYHPPFEQSPRSLGEVAAHFQEFWEVLSGDIIVLANTSEHGRLVFPPQNRGIVIYVAGIVLRATLR